MARLVLTMTMSLDGFFAGPGGELDWMTQAPDPEFSRDNTAQAFIRLGLVDEYASPCTPSRSAAASGYSPAGPACWQRRRHHLGRWQEITSPAAESAARP